MKKTWTRNDLIEAISENVGLSLSDSSLLIEEMFNKIQKFDKDKFIDNYTAKSIINKLDVI